MRLLPVCVRFIPLLLVLAIPGSLAESVQTDEVGIKIVSPQPWQVIQRVGFDPALREKEPENSAALGFAEVSVSLELKMPLAASESLEYRLSSAQEEKQESDVWKRLPITSSTGEGNSVTSSILVPAGGWYRLEIRYTSGDGKTQHSGAVERFGVGEVFLVAGQSYATNTNDEKQNVTDPLQRVVAFNAANQTWNVANDPQPAPDGSDGGSIWPPLGDSLVQDLGVPVAFVNVAVGATSSTRWLPEGDLHKRLCETGKRIGRFRALLWQQGESDVIEKTTTDQYVANLSLIRARAVRAWGFEPVWLAAKSTHHPTVYIDPEGEGRIRTAIDKLAQIQGFGAGPDTDSLTGENRGDAKSRRHFSAVGQRRAAEMWRSVLLERLKKTPTGIEAASFLLPDMALMSPAWKSEMVTRESCVLLQKDASAPIEAKLAFQPTEILGVTTADRSHQYQASSDFQLSPGSNVLTFQTASPVIPIQDVDLYLPVGAPHSYKHRMGNPDQNLLYRPGRWFHDHNVEVTYRRDMTASPLNDVTITYGTLPRTLSTLASGQPLTVGVSGDSISTGLDASDKTAAPPFQPGYPELVVAQLRVLSDSDVRLVNRAVSGWSIANGVADLDKLLAEKPDLLIVAYGMNDVGRRDPQWYSQQTSQLIQNARKADPEIEILLVSTMLGNGEWVHTPRDMFEVYRDELKKLVQPGVALADVTQVWTEMLRQKPDFDLTGNGLNHPNDFGHRLYAQALLQALVTR
ncbi:MAG: hypothetical protein DWI00_05925 [Planctomycetota bacterium]|nr:MAG: hypothetical protein DWI00_05925 [Planctomycetota bacterium]